MRQGWVAGTIPAQPVRLAYLTTKAAAALAEDKKAAGRRGVDPCCDVRAYTGDETVVDMKRLPKFDQSNAVAPKGWKPPLRG